MRRDEFAEQLSRQYDAARATSLYEVYGRHSAAKDAAWSYCRALCYQHHGRDLRVLTANTFHFTAAFLYEDEETGLTMIMRITKAHDTSYRYVERKERSYGKTEAE